MEIFDKRMDPFSPATIFRTFHLENEIWKWQESTIAGDQGKAFDAPGPAGKDIPGKPPVDLNFGKRIPFQLSVSRFAICSNQMTPMHN